MGILIERRKDPRGKNQIESGLRWAKLAFGHMVKDEKTIFIVPSHLNLKNNPEWLMAKGVFTREELPKMTNLVRDTTKREVGY